jgi:hypothetical protein
MFRWINSELLVLQMQLSLLIQGLITRQGVTKRCRLSLQTYSALVYESTRLHCGGGESYGVSANEYSCAHHVTWSPSKLWRSTSIFNLWNSPSNMLRGFNFSRVPITLPEGKKVRQIGLIFFFFFGLPLFAVHSALLMSPTYEGCLDSNPACCRCKWTCNRLRHQSICLATHRLA